MHYNTSLNKEITVLMPTYNQSAFIIRAINSLLLQTFPSWKLIIINDGSTDNTKDNIEPFLRDHRIIYIRNTINKGLGYSLNLGLSLCKSAYVSYLPSDDIYYRTHLQTLWEKLNEYPQAALSFSGVRHRLKSYSGIVRGYSLQPVQVLHRKPCHSWLERSDLVTDNLNYMFWEKLLDQGEGVGTGKITCEWVSHPYQRHKLINDRRGGNIFRYKNFYDIRTPITFHPMGCNLINEKYNCRTFQKRYPFTGLKILLVGELAYNAERICALEERGHKLYALWIDHPENFNSSGNLPFGNIETITNNNWADEIKRIKPDVIYALLNYQAIPLAYSVLTENNETPFVWHFKESPFYAIENGTWDKLVYLCSNADGTIYNNETVMKWFKLSLPVQKGLSFVLDGDLPKSDWFVENFSQQLSEKDGEIHTVIAGRPLGIGIGLIKKLVAAGIHLHFYGDIFITAQHRLIQQAKQISERHIHTHSNCVAEMWVKELSKYDAGWLHYFKSSNGGQLLKAKWQDLNSPARLSTYACAGLPMIQYENRGNTVHVYDLIKKHNLGVIFSSVADLKQQLTNKEKMKKLRENVIKSRYEFSFDYHADKLIDFFIRVIKFKQEG